MNYGTVLMYKKSSYGDNPPKGWADFFDTEKFPGKRGLPKSPKRTLYLALIADGVAADDIYDTLATPEGVDRAFAKLDTIKNDVVWWEAGAQPMQLLADGEVVTADSQGLSHPAFRACVELAAHQLDVPVVSDDSFIRVRYPINFTIAADKPQVVLGDADSAEPLDPSLLPSTVPIDDAATDQPLGGELPRAR